jgi:hypothetical protein
MRERQGRDRISWARFAGSYVAPRWHTQRAAGETVLPLLLIDPPHRQFWIRDEYMTDREVLKRSARVPGEGHDRHRTRRPVLRARLDPRRSRSSAR